MAIFADSSVFSSMEGEIFPNRDGVSIFGWSFKSISQSILNGDQISDFCRKLAVGQGENVTAGTGSVVAKGSHMQLPEMLFGNSFLQVAHASSGFDLSFDALGSLRDWVSRHSKGLSDVIKVPEASVWSSHDVEQEFKHEEYNWTFETRYEGKAQWTPSADVPGIPQERGDGVPVPWEQSETGGIDWQLLQRKDTILYYNEVILFEDFLHDHGYAQSSVKLRVMPTCWFVLLRFWLRVDGVVIKVWDTRYFHRFGEAEIWRETKLAESTYERLATLGNVSDARRFQDPNLFYSHLEVKDTKYTRARI